MIKNVSTPISSKELFSDNLDISPVIPPSQYLKTPTREKRSEDSTPKKEVEKLPYSKKRRKIAEKLDKLCPLTTINTKNSSNSVEFVEKSNYFSNDNCVLNDVYPQMDVEILHLGDLFSEDFESRGEKSKMPAKSSSTISIPDPFRKSSTSETNSPHYFCKDMSTALISDDLFSASFKDLSAFPTQFDESLSDRLKKQLLENLSKSKSSNNSFVDYKVDTTQTNIDDIINSSFHELGPFFGLPIKVKELIQQYQGISSLYDWQEECLKLPAISTRQNLIYSLPTSGGKTLVAEILILREIICHKKNVLFILPFIAVVQEKFRLFSQFAVDLKFLTEEYAAGKGCIPPKKRRRKNSIIIATIEKALIVIQSLLETKRLNEFGLIVVDELHLVSEESGRGALLETLLAQVLYSKERIQIIGMSATIGNLQELGTFLKAETYSGNFRPVELKEFVKLGNTINTLDGEVVRSQKPATPSIDPDGITELIEEVVPQHSVLIFCPTKKNCENVAILLTKTLSKELLKHKKKEKKELMKTLADEGNGVICNILEKSLPYGIAYHHSGLTGDERKLLEDAYREETISVICCTSTLAAGVNLPARRVILRSPYIGRDFISISKYKQMIGRAGRAGLDSFGESYLMCQSIDIEKVRELLSSRMNDCDSTLHKNELEYCRNLTLSSIALGVATTRMEVKDLLSHTLLHVQSSKLEVDIKKTADQCLSMLYKQGAITVAAEDIEDASQSVIELSEGKVKSVYILNRTQLSVSRLGKAAMKGGFNLQVAHQLYSDLAKASWRDGVLLSKLHLLFLVIPYDAAARININNVVYFNSLSQLGSKDRQVAEKLGITEGAMMNIYRGFSIKNVPELTLKRFYVALIIYETWKPEQTMLGVSFLFQVPRGLIQNLITTTCSFASNIVRFCEELDELSPFKAIFSWFVPILAYGCESEILPLLELPSVKRGRAKQLYKSGYKTLQDIAIASPDDLVKDIEHMSKKTAQQIITAAKLQLLEELENLKNETDEVLEKLGMPLSSS